MQLFFSGGFLSRLARPTKRKKDYSQSKQRARERVRLNILFTFMVACVAGVRRGRKEERRAREAREDWTEENRGRGYKRP